MGAMEEAKEEEGGSNLRGPCVALKAICLSHD